MGGTHGPCREETRVDHYLSQAGQREVGIKRRGAGHGVEIKALINEGATHTIGNLTARTQFWTKVWTAALDLNELATVAVRKSRRMRSYGAAAYATGCNIEVTEVRVAAESEVWTTLGIEAYGQLDQLPAALANVVRIHQSNPPEVDAGQALSYPAWLAAIAIRPS
jgi:hypothetical protein